MEKDVRSTANGCRPSVSVVLLFASFLGHAQTLDTLSNSRDQKVVGMFVFMGAGLPLYYSDTYDSFLSESTFTLADGSPNSDGPGELYLDMLTQSVLEHAPPTPGPVVGLGLVFRGGNTGSWMMDHALVANSSWIGGQYTVRNRYREAIELWGKQVNGWTAWMTDTLRYKYSQTALSMGYRFRATHGRVWLSMAIGFSYNIVQLDQEGSSYVEGDTYGNYMPDGPYSRIQSFVAHEEVTYASLPLDVGGGLRFRSGQYLIMPACYLTADFWKGYLLPRVGLEVQYRSR